jgi:hypothetical protein
VERIIIILLSKSNENGAPKESPNAVTSQPRTALSPRTGNAHSQALKSWLRSSKKVEEQACGMWTVRGTNGLRRSFGGPMRAVMLGALSAARGRLGQFKARFAPNGERASGWPFLRELEQRFVFIRVFT